MTTFLGLILSLSLLSSPRVQTTLANQQTLGQTESIATNEDTFTVQNLTAENIGTVAVYESDQNSVKITVSGSGTFTAPLTGVPVACDVNGQALTQGVPVRIMINSTTSVRATWTADIIVFDQDEKM